MFESMIAERTRKIDQYQNRSLYGISIYYVRPAVTIYQLTKEEEMDFVTQYRLLRKPSVRVIQTKYGDIYDCVDFYKQPAFDHPQLKNHTFYPEMQPSYHINEGDNDVHCTGVLENIRLKEGGCPLGTVPIRRLSKEDFYEVYKFTKHYAKSNNQSPPGTHTAVAQITNSDQSKMKYLGVGGEFSSHDLPVEPSQYSSGVFVIQNGDDRIKVGWTVNPTLNKDNNTRSFIYLDAGQSHCFNLLCSGFVMVQQHVPVDAKYYPSTKRGEEPWLGNLHVYQDEKTGDWWFNICKVNIGFWPKQIFTTMSNYATYIGVGGEAYGPTDRPLPPMGNGYYPVNNDMTLSAVFTNLMFVDENHRKIDRPQMEPYTNDPHYGVNYAYDPKIFGPTVFYGGINK